MKEHKKYYNSVEWGILNHNLQNVRSNGISFLKEAHFNIMNYTSYNAEQIYNELETIDRMFKDSTSGYIVIFDPISSKIGRRSIPGNVTSVAQVIEFIKSNNINLSNYKVAFTERILETPESFCGVVMADGKGNTVIEILTDTSNLQELTSAGVDARKTVQYDFYDFEGSYVVPYEVNRIKEQCQHYRGYYEFLYGRVNGTSDVYYTFYSDDDKYVNIFNTAEADYNAKRYIK